jgi:prepilin-type N-terminal cleavage/methylation domain-containing protein
MNFKKGVTLIELIVAIAIIGILGLLSFQLISFEIKYSNNLQKQKEVTDTKEHIRNVFSLITTNANKNGAILNVEETKVTYDDHFLKFDNTTLNYNNQIVYQISLSNFNINVSYEDHVLSTHYLINDMSYSDNYYLVRMINELP